MKVVLLLPITTYQIVELIESVFGQRRTSKVQLLSQHGQDAIR